MNPQTWPKPGGRKSSSSIYLSEGKIEILQRIQEYVQRDDSRKIDWNFHQPLFNMLYDGKTPQELAQYITKNDKRAKRSTSTRDIALHLGRPWTTAENHLHHWSAQCEDQALLLSAAYELVPEWENHIAKLKKELIRMGNYQSGVPLDAALPTLRMDEIKREMNVGVIIPYVPQMFADEYAILRKRIASIQYTLNAESLEKPDDESEVTNILTTFAACFGFGR